ncbi:MAG: L,D-transpeptidase family protein [Planctomycetes bacterium]|nr:L,D-transpeptidase family protein [Planctomycetota bacterium]
MRSPRTKRRRFWVGLFCVVLVCAGAGFVYRVQLRQFFLWVSAVRAQRQGGTAKMRGAVLSLANPRIIIAKADRRLFVYDGGRLAAEYKVGLGFAPVGHKKCEGDGKTPEGHYYVCTKNPDSRFYVSLGLSYPNADDAAAGFAEGRISGDERDEIVLKDASGEASVWKTALGGEISIHGNGSKTDWTAGCIALDDGDIEEFYDAVPVGTPVEIVP